MRVLSLTGLIGCLAATLMSSGCMGVLSAPNYGGRSGIQQKLLSATVDESVEQLGIGSRYSDKKVYVEVGDLDAEGVVKDYVQAAVLQELLSAEATMTNSAADADEQLVITVQTAGIDNSEPPKSLSSLLFAIIMYQEVMTAEGWLEGTSVSLEPGTARVRPGSAAQSSGRSSNTYTETWYLFGLIGPMKSSSLSYW